jgi:hypothetical protein
MNIVNFGEILYWFSGNMNYLEHILYVGKQNTYKTLRILFTELYRYATPPESVHDNFCVQIQNVLDCIHEALLNIWH